MFPLTGCFDLALSFFLVPITVDDVVYGTSGGEDSQQSTVPRVIQGAVDPTDRKKLEIIFGGSVSDGSIGIWTKEILHVFDMYAPGEGSMVQSFVTQPDGTVYRITKVADWTAQTGFWVYLGERHVKQDVLV